MASKSKKAKAAGSVAAVKGKPMVQREIQDEELRDNVRAAFDSAQDAYKRLSNGKSPQKALMDDKKLQKDLKEAANALRDAGEALREGPKKKKKGGLGRKLLLLIIGGGIAIAVSENLRTKVLDTLFGKEEEFEYTSTTSPSSAAPSGGS
jgi:hypothetical protein